MTPGVCSISRGVGSAAAAWTPASATALFWIDADKAFSGGRLYQDSGKTSLVTTALQAVGAWVQEGAITPDLLQSGALTKGYFTSLSSGALGVGFDGVDDRLASAQTFSAGAKTLAFRFQYATAPGATELDTPLTLGAMTNQLRLFLSGSSHGTYPRLSWAFDLTGASTLFLGSNGLTVDTNEHTVIIAYNGGSVTSAASYRVWVDGVEGTVTTRGSTTASGTTAIGAGSAGAAPAAIKYARIALLQGDQSAIVSSILTWL